MIFLMLFFTGSEVSEAAAAAEEGRASSPAATADAARQADAGKAQAKTQGKGC